MTISNSKGETIVHWVLGILAFLVVSYTFVSCMKDSQEKSEMYNACIRAGYEVVPIMHGTVCRDQEGNVVDEW